MFGMVFIVCQFSKKYKNNDDGNHYGNRNRNRFRSDYLPNFFKE